MSRVLGIELRRSAAAGTALLLAAAGALLLYFTAEAMFSAGWMQLAMTQRLFLAVLWPLALAAGAWQATRDRRSGVTELFASTPRPRASRVAPTLVTMAIAVFAGYLAMGIAGSLRIIGTAEYLPVQFVTVTAVGLLALIAAVWLGMAAGRALPWLVTAPALAVAGLGLLLLIPGATRPRGWLALVFSPIYEMNMPDDYATVPFRASVSQAVWLAALAVTAVLLFVADSRRLRVAAVLPVVLGAALAITVMPHQDRYVTGAVDPVARDLVCDEDDPRVCVSRVHTGLLPEIVGPARDALTALAQLPGAPATVHEDTTTYIPDVYPPWRTDVTMFRVEVGKDGHLVDPDSVLPEVVAGAFASPPDCEDRSARMADRYAAAHWLIGSEPVAPETSPAEMAEVPYVAEAVEIWRGLQTMPDAEAQARVERLRKDALACTVDGGLSKP
ncbi:hypothetical protein AB0M02_24755 [Actinoplanes sp. NPDC051861]|uniref:hypothetical protein n=1 Tax=Actinoplanes sp. NPDC051861 TaxID=3155170 RepID=UPI0034432976